MMQKAVIWLLLLNLLNTLFFAEVPGWRGQEKGTIAATGTASTIDSLVELVLEYCLEMPDVTPADDFDDLPDDLKRGKFIEYFLLPQPNRIDRLSYLSSLDYRIFQEYIPFLYLDVISPPPKA
jgi:hypothetical protein